MPMYDYECSAGHNFEYKQSIKDDALTKCQYVERKKKCGKPCSRIISKNIGFRFIGSGFYCNDYKNK